MTKLKMIRPYKVDDVSDHVFQEVCDLVDKMAKEFEKCLENEEPNIILSAFNGFHAGIIVALITENGLKDAVKTEAIGLMKNIQHMSGQKIFYEE